MSEWIRWDLDGDGKLDAEELEIKGRFEYLDQGEYSAHMLLISNSRAQGT